MLYESLTGILPFTGKDYIDVLQSILTTEPEAPSKLNPEITPELDRVILKAMEKNPQNRYTSMEEFCKEIEKVRSKGEIFKRVRKLTLQAFGFTTVVIVLAFALIQGGQYLISHFNLDSRWNQILLIWVMLGVLISGIAIYYHRKQEPKRILQSEIILYSAIFVIGYLSSLWYWKSTNIASSGSILPEPVSSIAVMYFEDNTGDEESKWLSRGLPHMLITSLEQIPELQVIGYQRLYDIIMEINKEDVVSIDKKTATEIAQKTGAKVMLMGSIFKWGDRIRIDYQLQDVKNGNIIYADKVYGDDPFVVADNLVIQLKQNLEIPSVSGDVRMISDITTHSREAYRYYIKGKDLSHKQYWKEALDYYLKALELDSTFAMAYLDLWDWGGNAGLSREETDLMLNKAVKYADQTSEREELFIYASEAYYTGHLSKFHFFSEQLINKYPLHADIYSLLSDFHTDRREFNLAIKNIIKLAKLTNWSTSSLLGIEGIYKFMGELDSVRYYLKKHIELYPDQIAMQSVVMTFEYIYDGNYSKAVTEARKAVSAKPEVPWTHRTLGIVYMYQNRFREAESEFKKMNTLGWTGRDIDYILLVRLYQGKYKKALEYILSCIKSLDKQTSRTALQKQITFYNFQNKLAEVKEIWKDYKNRLKEYLSLDATSDTYIADSLLEFSIPEFYYNGAISSALAACTLVEKEIKQKDLGGGYSFNLLILQADILFHSKDYSAASAKFQSLVNEEPRTYFYYRLAQCLFNLKEYNRAKNVLIAIDSRMEPRPFWIDMYFGYSYPRKFYLLGKVNEALGKQEEAIEAYKQLLDIWKEADADLPELIEAKQRIKVIKGKD